MRKAFISMIMVLLSFPVFSGEWTGVRTIGSMQSVSAADLTYVRAAEGGWGAAGCPNAIYVQLLNTGGQYKVLLAQVMNAKNNNQSVMVFGDCIDANYFEVEQLLVN